jgi:hypothetical protein
MANWIRSRPARGAKPEIDSFIGDLVVIEWAS